MSSFLTSSSSSSSSSLSKPSSHSHVASSTSTSQLVKSRFIWRFPPSKFNNLPSCNSARLSMFDIQPLNIDEELQQRQMLAILIYELGTYLNVSFTCIYTGVVYMHRFFMLHPFQQCIKELVAAACLFLACKANEMPRPVSEFTRHLSQILNQVNDTSEDTTHLTKIPTVTNLTPDMLTNYNQQIIDYENILLSTLGFCLNVEQPYATITKVVQLVAISSDIIQKACDIATKSIIFTLFSMKYTTNLIACSALYLAASSSQINIPDNSDGSQWFHLINEEFTEKLLKELADEYELIWMGKCSKACQQRFQRIQQQKSVNGHQSKSISNYEHSNLVVPLHNDQSTLNPMTITNISTRNSTSLFLSNQQMQSNFTEQGLVEHQTSTRMLSVNSTHDEYLAPQAFNQNQYAEQYLSNKSSLPMAKPIPTLMTSSNSNSYQNSFGPRQQSRFSTPIFKYPSSPPTQRVFCPPPPPQVSLTSSIPLHVQHYHHQYSSSYNPASSYFCPSQPSLFFHPPQDPSVLQNKRYGDPPNAPMKRFRYSVNAYQHF